MQTDDTFMLATPAFSLEEKKVKKAGFRTKPKTQLWVKLLVSNRCTIIFGNEKVHDQTLKPSQNE